MIFIDLLRHELKKTTRSKAFYRNVLTNIFYGIFGLYMAGLFLFLGFQLGTLLDGASSTYDPTQLMLKGLFHLMLISIAFRFITQQLSTVALHNYITLPIKRSNLIHFLLIKPLFNPINYLSLLIFIPFAIRSTAAYYDGGTALKFIGIIIFMVWFDSLTASFLKRRIGTSLWGILGALAIVGGVIALDVFHLVPFSDWSGIAFEFVLFSSFGWLIPLVFVACAYLLNVSFFKKNYYIDTYDRSKIDSDLGVSHLSFLDRFGKIGSIMELEIKLILRHKRTKSILYVSAFFLLYGLLFYTQDSYGPSMLFFAAICMTGIAMLMYGQWAISWDSMYFDGILTQNISAREYIEANYYLMSGFCLLSFILTTPYFFFGSKIIYLHFAALMINLGLNVFIYIYSATYNTKRLDLTKSNAMNYQGVTMKNFIALIPILLLPIILVSIFNAFFSFEVTMLIMSLIGFTGILLHRQLITVCVRQFQKRKYVLAEGFRESE